MVGVFLKHTFLLLILTNFLTVYPVAFAQLPNLTLKLDPSKPIHIEYKSTLWNKDKNQVESHSVLLRDAGTGRMARIELQETGPDTSTFEGSYQISFRQNVDVLPEIYLVPEGALNGQNELQKIDALIREGLLVRKPFFLRQESATQLISVFDTREQAIEAYDHYKQNQPAISKAGLTVQKHATAVANKLANNALAERNQNERQRLAEEERLKREEIAKKQAALDENEKQLRREQAKSFAEKAMAFYKNEKFKDAETQFSKSIELDPENKGYYYQYGVTLYKNEEYNRSLVVLPEASGPDVNTLERDYFIALNHMKLKENKTALKEFEPIKAQNDTVLSPSSSFFMGVLEFQDENYDKAQPHFEYVLDKSSDTQLDKQSEAYIEQIANIKAFQKNKAKKFLYTLSLGFGYDSNILNQAAAGSASDQSGFRIPMGATLEYRPIYTEANEFSALLATSNTISYTTSFGMSESLQQNDPLSANLSFPYKHKGVIFSKPYQITVSPAVETTAMNVDTSKSGPIDNRETILNSTILHNDNTFVMSDDWFSTYSLEVRNDLSQIAVSSDDDNQTATKVSLSTSQVFFKDKKKTTAKSYDGGLSLNQAKGKNQAYQRIDLGASYLTPWKAGTNATARVSGYLSNYPNATVSRTDNNLGLSLGLEKPIGEKLSTNIILTLNNNSSSVSTYTYSKYTLMTGLTYTGDF